MILGGREREQDFELQVNWGWKNPKKASKVLFWLNPSVPKLDNLIISFSHYVLFYVLEHMCTYAFTKDDKIHKQ